MLNPETLAVMIPFVAMLIPIVVILTNHQRKMAEIIHQRNPVVGGEVESLRQEIGELRALVSRHAIMIDDIHKNQTIDLPRNDVQQRLGAS